MLFAGEKNLFRIADRLRFKRIAAGAYSVTVDGHPFGRVERRHVATRRRGATRWIGVDSKGRDVPDSDTTNRRAAARALVVLVLAAERGISKGWPGA